MLWDFTATDFMRQGRSVYTSKLCICRQNASRGLRIQNQNKNTKYAIALTWQERASTNLDPDIDNTKMVFNYPKKKCNIQSDCDLGHRDPRFRCETIGFENYCVPHKCFRNSDCIDVGRHLSDGIISSKGCKFRACKYDTFYLMN